MASEPMNRFGSDGDAQVLLAEGRRVSLSMETFHATLHSFEANAKKRETVTSEVKILYRRPGSYRIEMLKSTKLAMSGAHVVYHAGEPTVRVRPGGLLKLLSLSLPIGDPQLLSLNRWRLDQVTGEAVLNRLSRPDYELALAGEATVGGERVSLIAAKATERGFDPHIQHEVVGFDAEGRFRLWQALSRPELKLKDDILYQIAVTAVTPNVAIPADAFRL